VRQILKFGLVGLGATLLDFLVFTASLFFFANPTLARAIGYSVGTGWSFVLNRNWVFDHRRNLSRAIPFFLSYTISGLLAIGIQYSFQLESTGLERTYLGFFASLIISATTNFILLRFLVFRGGSAKGNGGEDPRL